MLPEGQPDAAITSLSFESIANGSPAPIIIWEQQGNCIFINHSWCTLTKSNADINLGKGWLSFVDQKDQDRLLAAIQSPPGQEPIFFNAKSRSGIKQLKMQLSLYGNGPDVPRIIGWIHEVDQPLLSLTNGSSDIGHQISLMETVLDSTVSMISVIDRNFNVIFFNRQSELYTGVTKERVLGRNVFEVLPHLETSQYRSNVVRALLGETVQTEVAESILHPGRYFETFYIPLKGFSGQIEGVIIKARDRTVDTKLQKELIETNKLLAEQNKELIRQAHFIQSMFDSTVDVIAVVDREYRFLSINKKAIERYGYTKEQIEGKYILDLFPSVKHTGMYRDIGRALKGEFVRDASYTSEVLNKAQFENYYVPLLDEKENVYAVMIIGHDVSELMRVNEKLRISNSELAEKNKDLERSNNDLEQFAYVASHDLQEPIRKIATYANKLLTRSKDLNEETTVYLQRINNSTRRMYELINGLLAYSRLTRQQELFASISLDETLKQVVTDFDMKIQSKKAIINIQNSLPAIEAIAVQMNQLFSNLLSNSLKFAREDTPPVVQIASIDLSPEQIQFYELDPRVKFVSIFYVDNGIGFNQQFADKIFELFQRLHERNKYEGSGIGLAICKKIINNHHGLISVFSEEGKGTSFHIILPYTQKLF